MKIYTKAGDRGETGLYGGTRVGKDNARVEAYGTVDEVSALLGVAAAHLTDTPLASLVTSLQNELFTIGADLATPLTQGAGKSPVPRVLPAHTERLEDLIDAHEAELEPLKQFIVPGGSPGSAFLHHARAVARTAERRTVTLYRAAPDDMNAEVLRYLNRLADLLFVLARVANYRAGVADVAWKKPE